MLREVLPSSGVSKEGYKKIAAALTRSNKSAQAWREARQRISELSDAELAEAEDLEKLGRRRFEVLKMISAERRRRMGKGKGGSKPTLEVEVFGGQ